MGLIQHHTLQDYWATDEILSTPFFATVMKRNCFLLLLSFLHFNNNEHYVKHGQDGYDPLYKLGPVYKNITSFFENYYPTQNIALDEGLVPWRVNLHFRVYNPNKPHKFGMKSYQLCDETGYCTQYELYT